MYKKFLDTERRRESTRGKYTLLQAIESDRARVIYSTAFRRLQGKTQVFPLDENAAIRTRLTHSLEVAHVGKYLASSILEKLQDDGKLEEFGLSDHHGIAFVTVVEIACLLHDIGNPPFGHFGEVAISSWFKQYVAEKKCCKDVLLDLTNFDGNPQGFRIATRLSGKDTETGMNLTFVQLASMLKYIGLPKDVNKTTLTKPGAFETESKALEQIMSRFGLKVGGRFPFAYLMEAADDISYCLSDLEDGVEKEILTHSDVISGIVDSCDDCLEAQRIVCIAARNARGQSAVPEHIAFRSWIIRDLVRYAADTYLDRHEEFLAGIAPDLIDQSDPHGRLLSGVKAFARKRVYNHKIPQRTELSGWAVVTGLLNHLRPLLDMDRETFACLVVDSGKRGCCPRESRLLSRIAPRHLEVYVDQHRKEMSDEEEFSNRSHMIGDFISGMTDQFALRTYQSLSGINL